MPFLGVPIAMSPILNDWIINLGFQKLRHQSWKIKRGVGFDLLPLILFKKILTWWIVEIGKI